jgi:two-component system phosphate regulon sensor histidine kinase PhoR
MSHRESFRTPGKLLTLFLLVIGVPFAALAWLGWYVIEQDSALEERRIRERLDSAAGLICGDLDRKLASWAEALRGVAEGTPTNLPSDVACVVFDATRAVRHQSGRLVFLPFLPSQEKAFAGLFAAAEVYEYREENYARAGAIYRELARREDTRLRAAALMRLARCLRKQQRLKDALAVYEELAALGGIPVAGSPAELIARRERTVLLNLIGDERGASRESALLAASLWEGKYPIDQATFDFYRESLPAPPATMNKTLAMAEAVRAVSERWQQEPNQASGRMGFVDRGIALVALWRIMPAGRAVLVAGMNELVAPALATAASLRVTVRLDDLDGKTAWGGAGQGPDAGIVKHTQETGLPWVVRIASSEPAAEMAVSVRRRNLLIGGLALMLAVIVAASYFVFRAVNRELGAARLQSDFVAAVSHEFRTPLTAMCHLTELLEEGNTPGDRLHLYYHSLGKESRRLRGMVESLLDFARMEAGRQVYRMEDIELAGLVKEVVAEFREQTSADGRRIVFEAPAGTHPAHADREAIGRAMWNLLDNAVKYSPDSSTVRVTVKAEGSDIAIAVEDQGPGISREEQQAIFRKFTRGAASRALNVKGTGIGLAMVDHIVKGHGGRVRLESEPGRGSLFTILIPGRADRK